jgi:hypothetical protein
MQLRRSAVLLCALLLFVLPAAAQEPGQTITGEVGLFVVSEQD